EYGLTWAMAKLQIKVEDFPVYGSELKVITWPKRKDHFYAYRDLEVYCKDQKIATATSSYLMIDLKTRRPVSLIDKYEHLLDQENKHAVEEPPKKIASFQPMNWMEIKTGLTDLDINNHVNNVKYLDWAQNTQPIEFWAQHVVKEVSVNYFSELLADEQISVGFLLNSNELTVSGSVKDKEKFRVEIKTQVV
ncbi:MAG: thioesterase, partial [Schleiferiaceae bacterium]|nr:thioesterase [Schleiferiaceae bacterium]